MNKCLPLLSFSAFFAVASAVAAPSIGNPDFDPTGIDALMEPELTIPVEGATRVWVEWTQDETKVRIYPTPTAGGEWACTLPANHAGAASFTIHATDDAGGADMYTGTYDIAENTTDAKGLTNQRYPNMVNWTKPSSGSQTYPTSILDNDWYGVGVTRLAGDPQLIRLSGTTDDTGSIIAQGGAVQNGAGLIRTSDKLPTGVGSLWFKAKMAKKNAVGGGTLKIAKFTTTGSGRNKKWYVHHLATVSVPRATAGSEWHQFHVLLQDCPTEEADYAHYVIYNHTTPAAAGVVNIDQAAIDIQDIVLTPLLPDVIVIKDEADYAPGYPSLQDPIEFHIQVSNRWAAAPAKYFTPTLVWRQEDGDWHPTIMTNLLGDTVQGDGTYACVLDKDDVYAGPFEYFYRVDFTGYTPTFPAIHYATFGPLNNIVNGRFGWGQFPFLIHTNAWALLTDETGNISERRGPAFYPNFADRYDGLPSLYGGSYDVAEGTAAEAGTWDYTSRFDLYNLNEGYPQADAYFMTRVIDGISLVNEPHESTIEIPATYNYLTFLAEDGIRRFRSAYTHMAAVPRPYDAAKPGFDIDAGTVPGLEDCYAMQLVGDYTWQAIIHQPNEIDSVFAVTGALHSAIGTTEYQHGSTNGAAGSPFFWLEPNQEETSINPPSAGNVSRFDSEPVEHEREVTYYIDTLVTNVTVSEEVDLLQSARPAGQTRDIPLDWATVTDGGASTNWHSITPAWSRARPTTVENVIMEGVSGDGVNYFYTQYATVTVSYDDDDNQIVTTNAWSSGAWAPVVGTQEVDGETVTVTNWFPAQIPDTWLKVNWRDDTGAGDAFPTYTLTGLDTNGWNFSALTWSTNEWDDPMTFLDVTLESDNDETAGWAQIKVEESALAASTVTTAEYATYVESVELDVEPEEHTKTETYYTYRPVPDPYTMSQLGTRVQIDYDGFLMFRFCTTNGEYQVRRAAWQDFNEWAADINWFSRSFGLYDMKTFECDLEGRDLTAFESMNATGFEEDRRFAADHTKLVSGPVPWDVFFAENAWAIDERVLRAGTTDSKNFNKAVRLAPYTRIQGTLETTGGTQTDGRGTWRMKVRSSADDRITATYKHADDWDNWFLAVQIQPTAVSPAQGAYASVLFRYKDEENYAEARLIQKGEYRTVKNKLQLCQWLELEVWQTIDGVSTEIKPKESNGNNFTMDWNMNGGSANNRNFWRYPTGRRDDEATSGNYLLTRGWTVGISMNTSSEVEVYVWDVNMQPGTPKAPVIRPAYYTLSSTLNKGTFGFDVYDVATTFRPWAFPLSEKPEAGKGYTNDRANNNSFTWGLSKTTATQYKAVANDNGPADNYQQNTDSLVDKIKPWTLWSGATGTAAPGIGRDVPTAYYRLRIYRTGQENFRETRAPVPTLNDDWTNRWDFINNPASDQILSVKNYAWEDVPLPMSLWDDTYVQIQAIPYTEAGASKASNLGAIVVDEFSCDEWRGKTVYDPMIFGNNAEQRMAVESWIGTYAAIVADGRTGRKWELAISRANPDEAQAVTTPLMEHGVGDIMFSYQVVNGPVTFVVELVDEDDGSITTVGSLTAQPSDQTASFYAPGLKTTTGRLRVRTIAPGRTYQDTDEQTKTSGSDVKGVLYVDSLIAHDYPNDADTSWEAYNMLISSFITPADSPLRTSLSWRKELKFDGRSSQFDSYRSAVFNDATDHETLQGYVLDEHEPFLQTPSIATGIGEVSFWYRAAPGNTAPGHIRLMVANSSLEEDARWVELTTNDLNITTGRIEREREAMAAITNITTETWTYFSAEFFQGDYRMLRLYTGTNENGRVLIDNVLITEPVRASIDVGSVEFLPGVPLCTTNTGARVKLVNPRKNPEDIRVFIDWYVSTAAPQPVDIQTRSIEYETIREPHEVPVTVDGVKYTATYYITKTIAHTNDMVSRTILPPNLAWGYDEWPYRETVIDPQLNEFKVRGTGSIELFTNATEGRYTFVATSDQIPTKSLPADALVQYCVRVLYHGDFGEPILSEKQGRTRNGFWFTNPSWYEPIDLNAYLQTETTPVAHFWNFTVSTNQAFVNEIKPIQYASTGGGWWSTVSYVIDTASLDAQFVELIGAKSGSIGGWQIEHAGKDPEVDTLSPWAAPVHTNRLLASAAFGKAPSDVLGKGWGVYVVGGDASNPDKLFPAEAMAQIRALAEEESEDYTGCLYLGAPYGLTVKRSMGAYVDRICWGGGNGERDVQDLVEAGFRYIGAREHNQMGSSGYSLSWRGSRSANAYNDWNTQSPLTKGDYNQDQETALWPLAYEEEEVIPPLISQPVITAFGFTNGVATVTFSVSVTNEVALTKDDYVWRCQYSGALATLGEGTKDPITVTDPDGVHADADGTPATFTFEFPFPAGSGANFLQLIATPVAEEW